MFVIFLKKHNILALNSSIAVHWNIYETPPKDTQGNFHSGSATLTYIFFWQGLFLKRTNQNIRAVLLVTDQRPWSPAWLSKVAAAARMGPHDWPCLVLSAANHTMTLYSTLTWKQASLSLRQVIYFPKVASQGFLSFLFCTLGPPEALHAAGSLLRALSKRVCPHMCGCAA